MVYQSDQIYFDLSENSISTVDKIVELGGGDMSPLTRTLFKISLIWAMGQGYTPTTGFQPGGINPGLGGYPGQAGPAPRIAPKLQENPLNINNSNNPGQRGCPRPDRSQSQMADVKFKINTKEVQFETPEKLTHRVQNASEAKEMGHLET